MYKRSKFRHSPRKGFIVAAVFVLAAMGLGSGLVAPAVAAETARFAPVPWGIDSPAGRCVVCHSLERGGPFRTAPNLWGIVGAEKARDKSWYAYSPVLLERGGAWTEQDLDKYLAAPDEYLPGTKKTISVPDSEERQQIIDFLRGLKN